MTKLTVDEAEGLRKRLCTVIKHTSQSDANETTIELDGNKVWLHELYY